MMSTDSIEKKVRLAAPIAKVWGAIGDANAFGRWFGMKLEGPFVAGRSVKGHIVPTEVDADLARQQEPYRGLACDLEIVELVAEKRLSFRWQPGAEPQAPGAPTTLVTFDLEPDGGSTLLKITESGFDAIPLERRAKAFAENEGGWEMQAVLVRKYLDAR